MLKKDSFNDLFDLYGYSVYDSTGRKIGMVCDIYFSEEGNKKEYLYVKPAYSECSGRDDYVLSVSDFNEIKGNNIYLNSKAIEFANSIIHHPEYIHANEGPFKSYSQQILEDNWMWLNVS